MVAGTIAAVALMAATMASTAGAETFGPISFEPTAYATGNINGQNGWMKTGSYDVGVASVASFPAASGYGFGSQALRISNGVASGSFGDQTFSPALITSAGELLPVTHYDASFKIGSTKATLQPGLFVSVSPDDGTGDRMSYLGFEDAADGIHVIFYDVSDPGPLGTEAEFEESDIATLSRTSPHTIAFSIDFKPGPGNDVVQIFIDGALAHTGTTWEDYYRYDPEQAGNNNRVPLTNRLLFRAGGTSVAGNMGNGYLIDDVALGSQAAPGPTGAPGTTGANGANGASGTPGAAGAPAASNTIALKRKMAISFPSQSIAVGDDGVASVPVRCSGSVAQRCVGTLTLKAEGTVQKAVYSVLRGTQATVSVHLDERLRTLMLEGGSGVVAHAIARTEQDAGRPFRTARKLQLH